MRKSWMPRQVAGGLVDQLLEDEVEDTDEDPKDSDAKSEEQDPANDEEQKKLAALLKEADDIINK